MSRGSEYTKGVRTNAVHFNTIVKVPWATVEVYYYRINAGI